MKALVINRDRDTDRMAFQARQLAALGVACERLPAITPETLEPDPSDPYWDRWQRPLRAAEKALLASHRAAWQQVASGEVPVLVLEDDALLLAGTRGVLDRLAPLGGIDLVNLETRGRRKLVGRKPHRDVPMRRLWQDRSGSAAFVLWPSGARKLLRHVARAPGLSDAVISAAYDLIAWQADPARAIQIDQCDRYGFDAPIQVQSAMLASARPPGRSPAQRIRRVTAQIRMGLRQLRRGFGAERVEILPATNPSTAR